MEELIKLRDEIDVIDDQIVSLFEQRMAVAENAIKSAHHRLDDVNSELEHIKGGT